jgi:homoserine O-acetyltransferase
MAREYELFEAGDVALQSGRIFPSVRLAYKTYGTLDRDRSNVILYPTSFNAQHRDTEWLVGPDKPLDPTRYFIVIPNLLGNGLSSSPSHSSSTFDADCYPYPTVADNVRLQHRLLTDTFGIDKIALVYGFSMGGQQALQWGALYPDMVERICAICCTARTSPHSWVMLEGIKAALTADPAWTGRQFREHPVRGLRAVARLFAGWALSQAFYREDMPRRLGAQSLEAYLRDEWEPALLRRDAHDLLVQMWTWQHADAGANDLYDGDLGRALGAIHARTLVMPSETDLYFTVEDARAEAAQMRRAELLPIPSIWGHRAGNPLRNSQDAAFVFAATRQLLAS